MLIKTLALRIVKRHKPLTDVLTIVPAHCLHLNGRQKLMQDDIFFLLILNFRFFQYFTPLSLACSNGNAVMIELLIKAGADANSVSEEGQTVLMVAALTGRTDAGPPPEAAEATPADAPVAAASDTGSGSGASAEPRR